MAPGNPYRWRSWPMYVPYERVEGPLLTREVAEQFAKSKHVTHTEPPCFWLKAVDRSQLHKAKAYNPKFTTAQKQAIVQALDELILMFQASDTALTTILHGYRSNLPWHDVPNYVYRCFLVNSDFCLSGVCFVSNL